MRGGSISKLPLLITYRSFFRKFGTMFLIVFAWQFNRVETTVSERDPIFILMGGRGNLKILIIFIYSMILRKLGTMFPGTCTR